MNQQARARREREKEEVQRKILDAARELFATVGYDAVTMRRIADRIEYTPTAIYFHFRDKAALVRRLCEEDFGKLGARFKVLERVADPIERLRMLANAYITFALEHPHHYRLVYMGNRPPESEGDSRDADRQAYDAFHRAMTEASGQRRLRTDFRDVDLATQTFWAALHGAISLELARGPSPTIEWRPVAARVDASIGAVLHGLFGV